MVYRERKKNEGIPKPEITEATLAIRDELR